MIGSESFCMRSMRASCLILMLRSQINMWLDFKKYFELLTEQLKLTKNSDCH